MSSERADLISNLPNSLQECILSKLPISDRARTSLLSRTWRYKWHSLSDLIFDDHGLKSVYSNKPPEARDKFIREIVTKVLLQHNDPITTFTLSMKNLENYLDIDTWIMFLSNKSVECFTILLSNGEPYRLHSKLFSFPNLKRLIVDHCVIQLPPVFSGFNSLTYLSLNKLTIATDAFESLTAKCHVLTTLILCDVDGLDCVNVSAPKVKNFKFIGEFRKICFKISNPTLMSITFTTLPVRNRAEYLIKAPSLSAELEYFQTGKYFMKILGACKPSSKHRMFEFPLKNLSWCDFYGMPFEDADVVSCLIWLLSVLPRLKELLVYSYTNAAANMKHATKVVEKESIKLGSLELRRVTIDNITGASPEMEFIKMLLAKSPLLETITIEVTKDKQIYDDKKILKDLLCFRRASPTAQIIFLG